MEMYSLILKILVLSIIFPWQGLMSTIVRRLHRQLDESYGSPAYQFCECGRKNQVTVGDIRVVGGMQVTENEYPWMALITAQKLNICGGSLINDRYVLTAAHCFTAKSYKTEEIQVTVGEHDSCRPDTRAVKFSIDKLILHPRYRITNQYADIMLVRLNTRVSFNKFVRPICLPEIEPRRSTANKFGGSFATVLGWGYADTDTLEEVCILRSVNLEIYKPEKCRNNIVTVICAGLNDGDRDTCAGDSGGPLQVINSRERYELIGVTSTGIGCGNGYPGLYTDVVAMVPWIRSITEQDSMYCWR